MGSFLEGGAFRKEKGRPLEQGVRFLSFSSCVSYAQHTVGVQHVLAE